MEEALRKPVLDVAEDAADAPRKPGPHPAPPAQDATTPRRSFLWMAGCAGLGIAGLQATWATFRFARSPVSYGPPRKRNLGDPERFAQGNAVYVEDAGVFVLRDEAGMRAMSATCTHLGCNVRKNTEEGGYICPCHGSRYSPEGKVLGGPAPSALPFYRLLKDKRGRLVVDLGVPVAEDDRLKV